MAAMGGAWFSSDMSFSGDFRILLYVLENQSTESTDGNDVLWF